MLKDRIYIARQVEDIFCSVFLKRFLDKEVKIIFVCGTVDPNNILEGWEKKWRWVISQKTQKSLGRKPWGSQQCCNQSTTWDDHSSGIFRFFDKLFTTSPTRTSLDEAIKPLVITIVMWGRGNVLKNPHCSGSSQPHPIRAPSLS